MEYIVYRSIAHPDQRKMKREFVEHFETVTTFTVSQWLDDSGDEDIIPEGCRGEISIDFYRKDEGSPFHTTTATVDPDGSLHDADEIARVNALKTVQEAKANQEIKGDADMEIKATEFIKITPEELLQNLLALDDGESLDVGAWWDTTEEVCMWHKITNISATVQDAVGDTAPTYLMGYYGGHASAHVFAYDTTDHEGSVYALTELLKTEDLLDGDGTVCMEVPSEE